MKRVIFDCFVTLAVLLTYIVCGSVPVSAQAVKIASYNVENLFDLQSDASEYPEYHPNGRFGWSAAMLDIKLGNIASVIKDLDADVVALQEIESKNALELLRKRLFVLGVDYPFSAIAGNRLTPVRCAVLSRFPIDKEKEILVGDDNERSILKVVVDIRDNPLILYVNHWKSKAGPESSRIKYASALATDISALACGTDFILIGDFNADYNEFETFKDTPRLNDTQGMTGINHVIRTIRDGQMVSESFLAAQKGCQYLYNLWLEIPENRRWSVNFFGRKNSPDSMIVSTGLYDDNGVAYVDNSFDRFAPDYLFDNGRVFRWQRGARGKGRHLGRGYSDHLPIYAEFTTEPFRKASLKESVRSAPETLSIADLYGLTEEAVNVRIHNAVVIYKQGDSAVIKQRSGRAIYVYNAAKDLEAAMAYDLTVTQLNRHYGNLEIIGISDFKRLGRESDISDLLLNDSTADYADPGLRNEVVRSVSGIYENRWFHYGQDQKIRVYFAKPSLIPEDFSAVTFSHVRIGFHRHPEIIVEQMDQIR